MILNDPIRLARAAGILEGEGSFFTKSGGNTPVVSCQMTDLDVLEELKALFGGEVTPQKKAKEHYKDSWRWRVQGERARAVMEAVRKYMFTRRGEAIDNALAVWYAKTKKDEDFAQRVLAATGAYEQGEGSLREVASRYNISYETIRKVAWRMD